MLSGETSLNYLHSVTKLTGIEKNDLFDQYVIFLIGTPSCELSAPLTDGQTDTEALSWTESSQTSDGISTDEQDVGEIEEFSIFNTIQPNYLDNLKIPELKITGPSQEEVHDTANQRHNVSLKA